MDITTTETPKEGTMTTKKVDDHPEPHTAEHVVVNRLGWGGGSRWCNDCGRFITRDEVGWNAR